MSISYQSYGSIFRAKLTVAGTKRLKAEKTPGSTTLITHLGNCQVVCNDWYMHATNARAYLDDFEYVPVYNILASVTYTYVGSLLNGTSTPLKHQTEFRLKILRSVFGPHLDELMRLNPELCSDQLRDLAAKDPIPFMKAMRLKLPEINPGFKTDKVPTSNPGLTLADLQAVTSNPVLAYTTT